MNKGLGRPHRNKTRSYGKLGSWDPGSHNFSYQKLELLLRYKGDVEVPILGMVDDVLGVNYCSNDEVGWFHMKALRKT